MGYAKDIVEMVNYKTINDMDDDQLYYTKMFLDKTTRVSISYAQKMSLLCSENVIVMLKLLACAYCALTKCVLFSD